MCEIVEKLNTEAREEGREEGREEAINDINALNIRLLNENRIDDLHRAATDVAYQSQLLRELFPQKAH